MFEFTVGPASDEMKEATFPGSDFQFTQGPEAEEEDPLTALQAQLAGGHDVPGDMPMK